MYPVVPTYFMYPSYKCYNRVTQGLAVCKSYLNDFTDSPSAFPGATFHWAPFTGYFGSHYDVVQTENHRRWKIEGQIRKINVKSRTLYEPYPRIHIIQGIQVFMENGETEAFGMDLGDTVRVDSLEVPVGEHIKEFVVRSRVVITLMPLDLRQTKASCLV